MPLIKKIIKKKLVQSTVVSAKILDEKLNRFPSKGSQGMRKGKGNL